MPYPRPPSSVAWGGTRFDQLAEFRLTTPVTSIPEDAPLLEFGEDGSIRQKSSTGDAT